MLLLVIYAAFVSLYIWEYSVYLTQNLSHMYDKLTASPHVGDEIDKLKSSEPF